MPHLLHLDSSADPRSSSSREVTAAFVRGWQERGADFTVTSRDLHDDPPPHLPDAALHWAPRLRTAGEVVAPPPPRGSRATSTSCWPPTSC